ncbi:hypothetical protein Memar_1390 [Methanoculleus marisnigri JR1]|uniref:Uncharacterized protein n=1 Tax=Methanoculleus marisnigri (strain ATCC 35101 / DSM 1498 / JR1) TaxID=368407 RepID=A3CVB9_METMJ|nr:hypothetical protein Memar_1390 [Methanoculleus marisnigri JR1]
MVSRDICIYSFWYGGGVERVGSSITCIWSGRRFTVHITDAGKYIACVSGLLGKTLVGRVNQVERTLKLLLSLPSCPRKSPFTHTTTDGGCPSFRATSPSDEEAGVRLIQSLS